MRTILIWLLIVAIQSGTWAGVSVNFDGTDDYITYANALTPASYSMSAWFYMTALPDSGKYYGIFIAGGIGGDQAFYLSNNYAGRFGITLSTYRTSGSDTVHMNSLPSINKWHHAVVIRDDVNDVLSIYLDGAFITSAGTSGTATYTTGSRYIGARAIAAGYLWNGMLDDVMIFNRVLSAPEISAMYASAGAWCPRTGLLSKWTFENLGKATGVAVANGSTIPDTVGANNGTVADGADSSMVVTSSPTRTKRGRR